MTFNSELAPAPDLTRRRLFLDGSYGDAVEQLIAILSERRGLTVVSGPTGVGKTTLLHVVSEQLPAEFVWCQPASAPRSVAEIYRAILPTGTETQVPDEGPIPPAVREALELWLRQRAMKGTWTVLAIDDADSLPAEALSLVDALACLEPMLQVVLAVVDADFLEAEVEEAVMGLRTRVRQRLELRPLARPDWETLAAWWREMIPGCLPFAPDAVDTLGSLTGGHPGRMLDVAERAANLAREQWLQSITRECVQLATTAGKRAEAPDIKFADRRQAPSRAQERWRRGSGSSQAGPAPQVEDDIAEPAPGRATGLLAKGKLDPFRESPTFVTIDDAELLPVLSDPHGIHAEWFRVLQVRVDDWIRSHGGGPKTVVITGPNANAGKTLVAANLALLWAHSSYQRVLLVDGDLRRPQFHAMFEIPRRPGFADLLAGRCRIEDCTAYISEVGLHVIPAGRPGNPRQLAEPDRVSRAFDATRSAYDVIIVDSPPLSAMVDSRSMAGAADGVMVVLRAGKTGLSALKRMLDYLPADNLIGAVVNGAMRDGDAAYAEYRRSTRGG